jgi:NAD(P)-dependent dehydrogenase (short-subunit alcohol dehydrogenase family)
MKLDDSISAVVTGGASGLGAATARMLASHGVKVAVFGVNEDLGEAFAHEIGGVFCEADVTSTPAVEAAFAKARGANGQERILITRSAFSSIAQWLWLLPCSYFVAKTGRPAGARAEGRKGELPVTIPLSLGLASSTALQSPTRSPAPSANGWARARRSRPLTIIT